MHLMNLIDFHSLELMRTQWGVELKEDRGRGRNQPSLHPHKNREAEYID